MEGKKIPVLLLATAVFLGGFFLSGNRPWQSLRSPPPPSPCTGETSADFQCYKTYYSALVKQSGAEKAINDLRGAYASSSYVVSQCHQLSHVVGNEAYEKYGSIVKAFLYGDGLCWSGYYHGVVERAVGIEGRSYIEEHVNDFCKDIPGKETYAFDYYNCVHGIGHGLMAMTRNELFDSLRLCDGLLGNWERNSCYGGVFMENVMADYRNHKTDYLKTDDLLYPCTAVSEAYQYQCYLMQTSYVLKKNGYDFSDVFRRCSGVPNPYNEVCAQSAGRDASGLTVSNAEETKKRCALAPDRKLFDNCIIGAAKDFVSYFHGDREAYGFCALLDREGKALCNETVASYFKSFEKK